MIPFLFSANDLQIRTKFLRDSSDSLQIAICNDDESHCGNITIHFEDKLRIQVQCLTDRTIDTACQSKEKVWTIQITETKLKLSCNGFSKPEIVFDNRKKCKDVWEIDKLKGWRIKEDIRSDAPTSEYRTKPNGNCRVLLNYFYCKPISRRRD